MTIITYRAGIIASDSGCFRGDEIIGMIEKIKVYDMLNGTMLAIGCTGLASQIKTTFDYVTSGLDGNFHEELLTDQDSFNSIIVHGYRGSLITAQMMDSHGAPYNVVAEFLAIGAAAEIALGAMAAGANAVAAVEIARKLHAGVTGPVQAYDMREKAWLHKL